MRIIPVIDLLGGVVVRGVAGRRSEYRPIESQLSHSPAPAAIAQALVARFHPAELYIADLDAIAGADPAWPIYEELAACGVDLLVDAGVSDAPRAAAMSEFRTGGKPLGGVIVGLESVASPAALAEIVARVDAERLIFSLDLKQGRPLCGAGWEDRDPAAIANVAITTGLRRLIVLDLADVGVGRGVGTLELCQRLRESWRHIELIAGGGVRGRADLAVLHAAGCDAALVASALHDGRISGNEK